MGNILWFKEISDLNINNVGNKALNISKLFNNNIPVPNGFCVIYEAFDYFLDETKIKEKIDEYISNIDTNNLNSLYTASEKIQSLIINTNIPHKLRSQIIESYENINVDIDVYKLAGKSALEIIKAGRESTYVTIRTSTLGTELSYQSSILNVKGKEEVLKSIQKCWASMFTTNILNIKIKNNVPLNENRIGIIVQKMIDAEKSGIIYTLNPESGDKNIAIIEACLGQGEVITSGSIIPDRYVINKNTKEILEKSINKQDFMLTKDDNIGKNIKKNLLNNDEQKLTDNEINKIFLYGLQIENIYKNPQEIEFCINKDKVFISQSKEIFQKENNNLVEENLNKNQQNILIRGLNASLGIRSGYINIIKNSEELNNLKENQILVIRSCNYINLNLLDSDKLRKLSGVITDSDNLDSPLARIARDFGIPCIVNTSNATRILKQDQLVTIDGNNGTVYEEKRLQRKIGNINYYETATEVKVLIENGTDILPNSEKNDGVGILKITINNLETDRNQLIDNISKDIESKIEFFKNKPVWYYVQLIDNLDFLKIQFESIKKLQDKGLTNIGVAIPSITEIQQIKKIKDLLKEIGLEPLEEVEFGIIIDIPASSILSNELCGEQLDFVIIDVVKLTITTLNLINEYSEKYNELHPSILKQISQILKVCKKTNTETSILSKNTFEPEFVDFLIKSGVDSLICNSNSVTELRNKIAKSEKKLILRAVRDELNN